MPHSPPPPHARALQVSLELFLEKYDESGIEGLEKTEHAADERGLVYSEVMAREAMPGGRARAKEKLLVEAKAEFEARPKRTEPKEFKAGRRTGQSELAPSGRGIGAAGRTEAEEAARARTHARAEASAELERGRAAYAARAKETAAKGPERMEGRGGEKTARWVRKVVVGDLVRRAVAPPPTRRGPSRWPTPGPGGGRRCCACGPGTEWSGRAAALGWCCAWTGPPPRRWSRPAPGPKKWRPHGWTRPSPITTPRRS